ncbi:MAG TPA: TIGR03620 family F420-dependent LLM class oxidoreductase [Pseudonocardia sp.]|jgi:probable F420-dependent oxidoreductase|uniref:TIGR03620 family F420-dependent LLM class oxidoreductase n=1 Tax=Pseudonocardia sp. TaxID=60912 RepID=UPI002B8A5C33|nr:TIGR03620 family F420-dependent LLM class oxidoreductase [Pseudonocardia sp.]HTF53494.1 TIGR03620 family F420-dependent LLM class oxidoreductase [Pseudonocardia sp.]
MTKLDLGPIGVALDVSADDSYLDAAIEVEKLGYATIWLAGGQLASLDPIAKIIRATTAIPVAPGIIPLDVYGPEAVTAMYADLEATHPGRFVVGLGGPQTPRPLRALNEFLDRLDTGEPPVPADRRILAALGPRKLALARDRCAGAVPLLVTPAYTADARRVLGQDSTLVIDQLVVLDTDPTTARETARGPLRFLVGGGIGGYAENIRRMGFSGEDISELSDHLVDELVTWGDADAITARVGEHLQAGADQVVLGVLHSGDQPGPIDVARELANRLIR